MARQVAAAGHSVAVWNRTPARAEAVLRSLDDGAAGSVVAPTPCDAVAGADTVLAVMTDGVATSAVLLEPDLLHALPEPAIVCDLGTSGPAAARAMGTSMRNAGRRFVDAPVSGSVATVEAGQLLVMASGDEADIARAEPVLLSFAKRVVRTGPVGAGQVMKLAVNLVVHDLNAALSESLVLATRGGIDAEAAYDVLQASVVGAPFVQYKRAAFLTDDAAVAMTLGLSAKDLRLITELADQLGVAARVTHAVRDEVDEACRRGMAEADMAGLLRHLSSNN